MFTVKQRQKQKQYDDQRGQMYTRLFKRLLHVYLEKKKSSVEM